MLPGLHYGFDIKTGHAADARPARARSAAAPCWQLEVEFESFAELEAFWAAIPPAAHRVWSQRMQASGRCRPAGGGCKGWV